MEDVPQPAPDPYEEGDEVRIYLATDDTDSHLNDARTVVVDRYQDNLSEETGRELDSYSYRLRDGETGDVLDVQFRHRDLVPIDTQE